MSRPVPVTVEATARATPEATFDTIVPIDLSAIFHASGPLPGVAGVRDQSGPWAAAGESRIVELTDGAEVPERLTAVERPCGFAYRVGPFPRPLGLLVAHADGDWTFTPRDGGAATAIRWTYAFTPRRGRGAIVRLLLPRLWRPYAQRGLDRAVAAVEAVV